MNLKGKKVLVTGGSGFIASHLVQRLQNEQSDVAILTKYDSVIDNVRLALQWEDLRIIEGDIRNQDSLKLVSQFHPVIVFHFAAYNHVGDSFTHVSEALDSNAKGSANLLEAYTEYEKFIYISTSEVYGFQKTVPFVETMQPNPISPYAVGKYTGEMYARMKHYVNNLPIAVIRPFNAFGPYQSPRAVIAEMIIKCLSGKTITSTEGKQTREFNFVENLIDGIILAAESDKSIGQVINIGCGQEISIRDLILKIHKLTESTSELQIGKLSYRPTEIWRMFADDTKARNLLDWQPKISFDEGLERTIDWYRHFLEVYKGNSSLRSLAYDQFHPSHQS